MTELITVAAQFTDSRVEVLTYPGGAIINAYHGPTAASATLDDTGRRALIVALGGIPTECADSMLATVTAEDRAEVERLKGRVAHLEFTATWAIDAMERGLGAEVLLTEIRSALIP